MKIGTAPKITVGVIAVIALAFFGSRQLLSPEEGPSPSAEVMASSPIQGEQSAPEVNANRKNVVTAPSRTDEPQISSEEMEQIEDFFGQLEVADAQSDTRQFTEAESRPDTDDRVADNTDTLTEITEQPAEEVMNAYLEAFRVHDYNAMRSLLTSDLKERDSRSPAGLSLEVNEVRSENWNGTDGVVHPGMVGEMRRHFEQVMYEPMLKMISQAEVVSSGYVDDEFHFRLGMPAPEMPVPSNEAVIETEIPPPPKTLYKMRKEAGVWRIYYRETLN